MQDQVLTCHFIASAAGVYVVGEAYDILPEQYELQYTMSGGGLINYPLYTVGNNTFVNYGEESMEELATAIQMNRNSSIDSNLHGVSHVLSLS